MIDGELGPAKLWSGKIRASYPSLLDPDLKLVRAFGVENSAYVVLIDTEWSDQHALARLLRLDDPATGHVPGPADKFGDQAHRYLRRSR